MKITLIHNPSAGDGSQLSGKQIIKMIEAAGHKVNYQSAKQNKWKKAIKKKSCDIIAVAGGDGTVGKVARRLVDNRIPIAILPIGTANNIANSLGLTGRPLKQLIRGWKSARRINFDVGRAKGPWGSNYFIEGFGIGVFATTVARLEVQKNVDPPEEVGRKAEIKSVLRILKDEIHKHRPKKLKIRLDDQDLSGEYIMVEALNIRYVGPNLDLVPGADTNDGLLDVVLLPRREQGKLRTYLTKTLGGGPANANLSVRQGRHLQLKWDDDFPVHIDDKAWPTGKDQKPVRQKDIDIKVGSHAVVFLTPRRAKRKSQGQSVTAKRVRK